MSIVTPTLSGIPDMTGAKFVELVLRKLGALSAGESVSAEDYADTKALIDASMKAMHIDGLLWWAVKIEDVAFTGSLASKPADCAVCVYASWNGRPVRFAERVEYERIQDKTESGTPEIVVDDGANLILYPVPDSGSLRLAYQRELLSVSPGLPMDVPPRLVRSLIDYMAYEIEPWFEVSQSKQARIVSDGQRAYLTLRKGSAQTAEPGPTEVEYF